MATLKLALLASVAGTYTGANDVSNPVQTLQRTSRVSLSSDNEGAGQSDLLFTDTRTIAASGSENLDLSGGLYDAFGNLLNFAEVTGFQVEAALGNTNDIIVGGAATNAFRGPFIDATDKVRIQPGAHVSFATPGNPGWAVVSGFGDILKVANAGAGSSVSYTITIIGRTPVGADVVPDAFSFTDRTDATAGQPYTSSITLAGLSAPTLITVVDGMYSINGGTLTAADGTVSPGDVVLVRAIASNTPEATVNAVVTIGGVSDTFSVTTAAAVDTTPSIFGFIDATGATAGQPYTSAITVSGINAPSPIHVTGGEYKINSGSYTAADGIVVSGDVVTARGVASSTPGATVNVAVTIGGVNDTFSVTTAALDTTPDAFTFTDVTGVAAGSLQTAVMTVAGINAPATISITGGLYKIGSGSYTSTTGSVVNGDVVTVQLTASSTPSATQSATLSVGGVSDTFTATTAAGAGLPTFANEAETTALASAWSTAAYTASARETTTVNWWIKRLKAAGTLAKLSHLIIYHDNKAVFGIDLVSKTARITEVNPGANLTFNTLAAVTTSTWGNTGGVRSLASTSALRIEGINLKDIPRDHSMGVYTGFNSSVGTAFDVGSPDGNYGVGIAAKHTATNMAIVRAHGANINVVGDGPTNYDGLGLISYTREDAANVSVYKNGQLRGGGPQASAYQPTTLDQSLTWCKSSGATVFSPRPQQAFFYAAQKLTAADHDLLYRAIRSILESRMWGDVKIHEPGYAPAAVSADTIVIGWTSGAVLAAVGAARGGNSVVMVGGWRDRTHDAIGGLMAGGLAMTDLVSPIGEAASSLSDWVIRAVRNIEGSTYGLAQSQKLVLSRTANWIFRRLLDPSRPEGNDIELYATNGIASLAKDGVGKITSVTTTDGRTFTGADIIDCTYEADTVYAHGGITYVIGSEAAASGDGNGWNGELGVGLYPYPIDPYVTPGSAGSGRLPRIIAKPAYAIGDAVPYPQAYNFRNTLKSNSATWVPFPSTPPAGYNALNYEAMARHFAASTAAGVTLTLENVGIINNLAIRSTYDFNGLDFLGHSTDYVQTGIDYAARETLWAEAKSYNKGAFYWLRYSGDSRIPTSLHTDATDGMNRFNLAGDHYLNPHPNDEPYWSPAMYIREMRRMRGPATLHRSDFTATDGTAIRVSAHTIAMSNYRFDRHPTIAFAETTGTPRIVRTGGIESTIPGGANNVTPVPWESICANPVECPNLVAPFAPQMDAIPFGAYRMEVTFMMACYMAGLASAVRKAKGCTLYEAGSTYYTDLRTLADSVPRFTGENIPQLLTVN